MKTNPNLFLTKKEKIVEKWLNTERVQLFFNTDKKFIAVNKFVTKIIHSSQDRLIATDAVVAALLNRKINYTVITGSLDRTANWIGSLMSVTRLKWSGRRSFEEKEWDLWHRKNDVKQVGPLTFARVFGRGFDFWAGSMVECTRFINEYVLNIKTYGDDYEVEKNEKN